MNDTKKRYGKALAVAIVVHLALCLVLAELGFSFNKRPPQVLEVTLAGGPPPKKGSPKVVQTNKPQEKKQVIIPKKDDIIEKKETAPTPTPTPQTAEASSNTPGDPNGTENGVEGGTGNNPSGNGQGEGEKRGVPATPPRVISSSRPGYPSSARSNNIEGTAYVKALVNDDGRVDEAFIASSSGNSDLDEAAVNCLYKWRFSAAKDAYGQKVPCYVTVPIKFSLR